VLEWWSCATKLHLFVIINQNWWIRKHKCTCTKLFLYVPRQKLSYTHTNKCTPKYIHNTHEHIFIKYIYIIAYINIDAHTYKNTYINTYNQKVVKRQVKLNFWLAEAIRTGGMRSCSYIQISAPQNFKYRLNKHAQTIKPSN